MAPLKHPLSEEGDALGKIQQALDCRTPSFAPLPQDVDAILVTHPHFDHIGDFGAFPNAPVYVQLDEDRGWLRMRYCPRAEIAVLLNVQTPGDEVVGLHDNAPSLGLISRISPVQL